MPSELYNRIYSNVRTVPYGTIATYGQIAELSGMPFGARVVGWALRALPKNSDVPWQRIVAKGGKISIVNPLQPPTEQIRLLKLEGARISDINGKYSIIEPSWYSIG